MSPGMPRISAKATGGICTRAVLAFIGSGKGWRRWFRRLSIEGIRCVFATVLLITDGNIGSRTTAAKKPYQKKKPNKIQRLLPPAKTPKNQH
jgi:hypothetical protein